jgi:hypothetical protein
VNRRNRNSSGKGQRADSGPLTLQADPLAGTSDRIPLALGKDFDAVPDYTRH